jgi:ribose/xylose/arabinose/galactoside ABC-type transport system permease subunit
MLARATRNLGRSLGLFVGLAAMFLLLAVKTPDYFSVANARILGQEMAQLGIASTGTALLMIAGYIDLSIGSLLSLSAVAAAISAAEVGSPLAWLFGVVLAGAVGLTNGLIVWRIRVSPLIVTLGGLTAIAGVANLIGQGERLLNVPDSFDGLGALNPLGVPIAVWIMLLAFLSIHVVLRYSVLGRHIYAIGGNREAAMMAGVPVRRIVLGLFLVNGLFIGIAAVLTASRFGTASPQFGVGFELQVITAVILGGVAFQGGEGDALGVFLGVVLLTVIASGLVSLGVDPFYTSIVQGGILVVAVAIEQVVEERREHHRRAVAMAGDQADSSGSSPQSGRDLSLPDLESN